MYLHTQFFDFSGVNEDGSTIKVNGEEGIFSRTTLTTVEYREGDEIIEGTVAEDNTEIVWADGDVWAYVITHEKYFASPGMS